MTDLESLAAAAAAAAVLLWVPGWWVARRTDPAPAPRCAICGTALPRPRHWWSPAPPPFCLPADVPACHERWRARLAAAGWPPPMWTEDDERPPY